MSPSQSVPIVAAPEYVLENDCIRVRYESLEVFVSIDDAREMVRRLNRALDEWYEGRGGVVVPFPRDLRSD